MRKELPAMNKYTWHIFFRVLTTTLQPGQDSVSKFNHRLVMFPRRCSWCLTRHARLFSVCIAHFFLLMCRISHTLNVIDLDIYHFDLTCEGHQNTPKQEYIPVGCVPSAAVAISTGMHAPHHAHPLPCMTPCHVYPLAMHTPLPCTPPCHAHHLPHMPPCHTCPLAAVHAPLAAVHAPLRHTPLPHMPSCHSCPLAMHAPG